MKNRYRFAPYLVAGILATASLGSTQALAQTQDPQDVHPWRNATAADQAPDPSLAQSANQNNMPNGGQAPMPAYQNQQPYPQQPNQPYAQQPYPPQQQQYQQQPQQYQNQYPQQQPQGNYNQTPPPPMPAHLTIKPGTYVTVRVNQWLSSDKNHAGDAFTASLAQPLIVDGVVLAERGQTVGGHVTQAEKAGRVEGTSKLAIQLNDLTLADGQTVPIQTSLISRNGPTSVGRDVGAVAGTTAVGAAVGAAADWGRGAAIGAGAGAAAGILGVLLTRGRPTVIYPESVMTFRIDNPVDVSTEHAPQAFRYVQDQDYGQPVSQGQRPGYPAYGGYGPAPVPAYGYAAPAYGYPYAGYPYPYYGGLYIGVGPRFYGRGYYRFRR